MTQLSNTAALSYLKARPLTPVATLALQFAVFCVACSERRKSRIALSKLDDHLLKDIGISRYAADLEARRPFWED